MKRIVRTVWISALSGLAFLGACCTQNGLTRKERKQLVKEREQVEVELSKYQSDEILTPDLDEYMAGRKMKYSLENRLDSINFRLGDTIDLDHNVRRRQILQRIDSLNFLIETYTYPCIYGSPEMMEERANDFPEYNELYYYEEALEAAKKELKEFDLIDTEAPEIHELLYGGPSLRIKPLPKDTILFENPEK